MNGAQLRVWIRDAAEVLVESNEELAALDSVAGDGDLGISVSAGIRAVVTALADLDADADANTVWRAAGAGVARGNPSTFSALVASGLLAAASVLEPGRDHYPRADVIHCLRAASNRIAERGGASVGDRTVLDALCPSIDALQHAEPGARAGLRAMMAAAAHGVEQTRTMMPTKGRAAWTGDRGLGHPDAGATAYLRFLEALDRTFPPDANV